MFQPVAEGWCKYESLTDGTLSLLDVAEMNDAIRVRAENMRRAQKAQDAERG